ncbi:MAG: DegV family protein [Aggregatilineales bacterium]
MGKIRIVTDSAAHFLDPSVPERYRIGVLPHTITLGGQRFRDGIDLTPADFARQLSAGATPVLTPPTVEQFQRVYTALMRETDSILSIHLSQTMSGACTNARAAAQSLLGRCTVHVLDSMTASAGLGWLVETAGQLAEGAESLDALARIIRKHSARVYTMFYIETLENLQRAKLLSESHATLGTMLGLKVFVTIEDGQLVAVEKARTRVQAVDKMLEFAAEFNPTNDLVILQATDVPGEPALTLQARLSAELNWSAPIVAYQPSLGAFLGADATGIIIYQRSESRTEPIELPDHADQQD